MISETLLEMLACPVCTSRIEPLDGGAALLCRSCGLKFPVLEGIPVMVPEEADAFDE